MKNVWARFLSYAFHPAVIPLFGFALVYAFSPFYISPKLFLLVAIYLFLGTYIFPLGILVLLKKMNVVSSLQLENANERYYPYVVSAIFFFITAYTLRPLPLPDFIIKYLYAGAAIVGISLLFLKRTKISMHMAGTSGLLALSVFLSYQFSIYLLPIISIVCILAGLMGTARLALKAHTLPEIVYGFLVGFCSVWMALII